MDPEVIPFGGEFKLSFVNVEAGSHYFNSLSDAVSYGKQTAFEFVVTHEDKLKASWTISGGLRYYEDGELGEGD